MKVVTHVPTENPTRIEWKPDEPCATCGGTRYAQVGWGGIPDEEQEPAGARNRWVALANPFWGDERDVPVFRPCPDCTEEPTP